MSNPVQLLLISTFRSCITGDRLRWLFVANLLTIFCAAAFSEPPAVAGSPIRFSFTVTGKRMTSAGVFKKDGTLIRTLWSGDLHDSGTYLKTWNGKDDEGRLVSTGNYEIRVLSNDVKYTWEGVIGNTSNEFTGPTIHHGHEPILGMAIAGNTAYHVKGYSEGFSAQSKFVTTNPQTEISILTAPGSGQRSVFCATDGVNVYWAGNDPYSPSGKKWFVFATTVDGDHEVEFSRGDVLNSTRGYDYKSVIAYLNNVDAVISGLAVQKSAKHLFVAREELDEIQVFNKSTGAFVRALSVKTPRNLCVDDDDNLWVISGTKTVQKFVVQANGTLSDAVVTLSGLSTPLAIAESPTDDLVVVADGGASQQLKAYDNTTGRAVWTYGQAGGYAKSATVATDKFYFTDAFDRYVSTFIAFQPDGSFWVGDSGNSRALHYAANRTYIDQIMYLAKCYSSFVDTNAPNRVFANYLEFRVDNSKPLGPNNGSWTLVNNWGCTVPPNFDNQYHRLRGVTTLSNGRTYALLMNNSAKKFHVVELVNGGLIRFTGLETDNQYSHLYPDGSLREIVAAYGSRLGQSQIFTKKVLVGFDGAANPIWSAETPIASTPPTTRQDPIFWGNPLKIRPGEVTSSNVVIAFDGGTPPNGSEGYHLGGIRLNDNKWLWRTAKSTNENYSGPYPDDGAYDIGNGSNGGSTALALDRSVIWGFNGEGWKNSQTNKWTHVYDNGLFINTFGITGPEIRGQEAAAMMAGNAFSPSLVKNDAGNAYLYHNDGSAYHSGIHRWKITGLSSIQEQVIPVAYSSEAGGLTGYYFESSDLNNLTLKTTRVDAQLDFNWTTGTTPAGTRLSDTADYSVRWSGFVAARSPGEHKLYVKTAKGVRLWVDGQLHIDQWDNASLTEHVATVTLQTGVYHAIQLESKGNTPLSLQWSGDRQPKELIPSSHLYPEADRSDSVRHDLLYGLSYNTVLQSGLYGWQRDPAAENYTDRYANWWQAVTNRQTYQTESPDLWVKFRQPTGSCSITRNLGTGVNPTAWSLSGEISYAGSEGNAEGGGGAYLEVLDKAGKIIARTFVAVDLTKRVMTVFGNTAPIAAAAQSEMRPIIDQQQPVSITADSTGVTFSYAAYQPVRTKIFDPASDWRSPRTMRLLFYTEARNSDRIINLKRMKFVTDDAPKPTKPTTFLLVYPNPTQSTLTVAHEPVTDLGTLSVVSVEGKTLLSLGLKAGSSNNQLDLSLLPAGTYLIVYRDGLSFATARVIKH